MDAAHSDVGVLGASASIIAMLLNWLFGERLRPQFLKTLLERLKTAGVAVVLVSVTLIVWIVSAYSLCVSAILTLLDETIIARTYARQ